MIVYDDNDSLRREEILGVTRFEGAAIGTKGGGVKQQASLFLENQLEIDYYDQAKDCLIHFCKIFHYNQTGPIIC